MMVKSITFFVSLLIFSSTIHTRSDSVNNIAGLVARNVVVETDISRGSGIILSTGVVLSAFHNLDVGHTIKVNGVEAKIALVRPDLDLMILLAPTADVSQIQFGDLTELGSPVIAVGNPAGVVGVVGVVSYGRIVFTGEGLLFLDTLAMHGFSGGGVYNPDGVLVGMIQRMLGNKHGGSWVTVAIGSSAIVGALETGP